MKKLSTTFLSYQSHRQQTGASLLVVLMVLVIVSMLGLAATQIAIQGERAGRNDRDRQIAMQAAEAALLDAEFDIEGTAPATSGKTDRSGIFQGLFSAEFTSGCGTSGNSKGLCTESAAGSKPAWLSVNLADASDTHSVEFGNFTGRSFPSSAEGIAPARLPRYMIENIPDYGNKDASSANTRAYRITAIGFGPNDTTRVILQSVYRK